jgi:putative hydrolase of the HAD superfamily
MVRAVLLDAVGTLIRPWPSVGSVYSAVAADWGVRCPPNLLNRNFRRAYGDLMPERFSGEGTYRTSESREKEWWMRAVARTFELAGCPRIPDGAVRAAFYAFAGGSAWRPYADALPLLEKLSSRGLSLAVVSNFDSRLRGVLDDLGLARCFGALVISSECGYAKPSPRIYGAALRKLDVRPGEALHVGDRREQDFLGPRRAGIAALRLVRKAGRGGPGTIRSLSRIPALLDRL